MRLCDDEKGTVTIYLTIVFLAMFLFAGIFIDLARIKIAQNQVRRAIDASARSVLADYNKSLKSGYGLFTINKSEPNRDFAKYIRLNLTTPVAQSFELVDFRFEESDFVLHEPISDLNVLKGQVLEDMKYTAPVEITRELIDKFKTLGNMAKAFNNQNNNRKTVKKANGKLIEIGANNENIKKTRDKLRDDKNSLKDTNNQIAVINRKTTKSKSDVSSLKQLEKNKAGQIEQIQQDKTDIQNELEASIKKRMEIQQQIAEMERETSTLNNSENDKIPAEIQENMDSIKKENIDGLKESLARIQNDTELAAATLKNVSTDEEIKEEALSLINIGSVEQVCAELNNGGAVDLSQDIMHSLTVIQGVYLNKFKMNPIFQNQTVPVEQLENKVNNFTEDESDISVDIKQDTLNKIFDILSVEQKLTDMRDELYVNEYAISRFSYLTSDPKGDFNYNKRNTEAEYILYGGDDPTAKAIAELYATRFTLDSLAYFMFSKPPAPVELLSRTVYCLLMGAVQASVDTYILLADGANTVNIAEMIPDNPLEEFNFALSYKDHLRLFMLLHSDEGSKLKRMSELIKQRSKADVAKAYTLSDGSALVSIKLWFLPLAGLFNTSNGPFGTEIINGRCYISKDVEFGY